MQRGRASEVFAIDVQAKRFEEVLEVKGNYESGGSVSLSCNVEHRQAICILHVDVRAFFHQHLGTLEVSLEGSKMEGGEVVFQSLLVQPDLQLFLRDALVFRHV